MTERGKTKETLRILPFLTFLTPCNVLRSGFLKLLGNFTESLGLLTVEVLLHMGHGPGLADFLAQLLSAHLVAVATGPAQVEGISLWGKRNGNLGESRSFTFSIIFTVAGTEDGGGGGGMLAGAPEACTGKT